MLECIRCPFLLHELDLHPVDQSGVRGRRAGLHLNRYLIPDCMHLRLVHATHLLQLSVSVLRRHCVLLVCRLRSIASRHENGREQVPHRRHAVTRIRVRPLPGPTALKLNTRLLHVCDWLVHHQIRHLLDV